MNINCNCVASSHCIEGSILWWGGCAVMSANSNCQSGRWYGRLCQHRIYMHALNFLCIVKVDKEPNFREEKKCWLGPKQDLVITFDWAVPMTQSQRILHDQLDGHVWRSYTCWLSIVNIIEINALENKNIWDAIATSWWIIDHLGLSIIVLLLRMKVSFRISNFKLSCKQKWLWSFRDFALVKHRCRVIKYKKGKSTCKSETRAHIRWK